MRLMRGKDRLTDCMISADPGVAIEVKCLLGVGNLLRISRLDRLESKGLSRLYIARPKFREDMTEKSLPTMVSEIRNDISAVAPTVLSVFNEKLMRVGYLDADARHYSGLTLMMYELCVRSRRRVSATYNVDRTKRNC
jgi:Putative  PD-(D/E)XK family member, (DUF4420)